ncbi:MAG: NADH-quinone oxidoreductase subunit D [Bacteroidota bacterium]
MSNKIFNWKNDRSMFPELNEEGKPAVELDSQKFIKVWQGPNHPGVTGNMSLELTISGDEVMESKTHVGYLHRGFEKLFERRSYMQCFPTSIRMCVPEPDSNEYNLSRGTELLSGIEVPEMANWLRMMALELARLQVLLRSVPGQGGTIGLGLPASWGLYYRELILDRFEELTGGRVYHMYILPGGVRGLLPDGFKKRLEENLVKIESFMKDVDRVLYANAVFKKRTKGIGVVPAHWIDPYGATGPVARAAGYERDVRKDYPYLYYDQLDFGVNVEHDSDVFARFHVRRKDVDTTVDLLRQIMAKMPEKGDIRAETPNVLHWKIPKGETLVRSESSRGEYLFYMVADGSMNPRRINLRGPSYTHGVVLLEKLLTGANISDVSSIMVSLATCPPEIER